mmetsp:Transcript_97953/g.168864  ORF Transcript_97953/g.168864 Transcript_97953/m.168864 type:complete len:107 (-) Transcript_97953:185-505(-)
MSDSHTNGGNTTTQDDGTPAAVKWFMKLLEPGSGINHGMWAFLNIIFVIIAVLILILYIADVGGIHTLVFGFLLLGLTASANWLMWELLSAKGEEEKAKAQEKKED